MSTNLQQMQDRAASIVKEQTAINDRAVAANRDFTADEQTRYDSLTAEFDRTKAAIERANETEKRGLSLDCDDPIFADAAAQVSSRIGAARYEQMFGTPRADHGWKNGEEFLRTIALGLSDTRMIPSASLGESTGSGGGFAVPEVFSSRWLDAALESEIVRPRATIWPMESNTMRIPAWDVSDNSSTLFGGFSCSWIDEHGTFDESDPKLRSLKLDAKKLGLYTKCSNEILEDGLGFSDQLNNVMAAAISWAMDHAFLRGTGAGQPLGAHNASSTVEVSAEGGQVADTILYTNLTKMFARLHPSCVKNSVWVASQTTIPQLLTLTLPIGTSGAHIPVMRETDEGFTILTRPVLFTEKLPTLGDSGDIILADFSQYQVGMRREVVIDKSSHIGFTTDEVGFRGKLRVDGKPSWPEARTPKTGDSLSWCVKLESR